MSGGSTDRISGSGKRLTLTSPGVEISGSGNSVTCTNPNMTSVRMNGCANNCKITSGNPRITVRGSGNTLRTSNATSARDIIASGSANSVYVDRNAGDIDMRGSATRVRVEGNAGHIRVSGSATDLVVLGNRRDITASGSGTTGNAGDINVSGSATQVRVHGNAGQIRVSGSAARLVVLGNVGSITLLGNSHDIYIQGNCTGEIRIGENGVNTSLTKQNKIVIGGSSTTLRIETSGYRNQIQCTRITTIHVSGDENRIRANCEDISDTGTNNSIEPHVNFTGAYQTSDRDRVSSSTAIAIRGNGTIVVNPTTHSQISGWALTGSLDLISEFFDLL